MVDASRPVYRSHEVSPQGKCQLVLDRQSASFEKTLHFFVPSLPQEKLQPSSSNESASTTPVWKVKNKKEMRTWIESYAKYHLPKCILKLFKANNLFASFSKKWHNNECLKKTDQSEFKPKKDKHTKKGKNKECHQTTEECDQTTDKREFKQIKDKHSKTSLRITPLLQRDEFDPAAKGFEIKITEPLTTTTYTFFARKCPTTKSLAEIEFHVGDIMRKILKDRFKDPAPKKDSEIQTE